MRKFFLMFLLLILISGCAGKQPEISNENSSIVYEIFPSSFYDTDKNGVGDLNGIMMKLDYIQSLGAGAIWLTPVTDGASYHLYDVTDYMNIDPLLGTMEDFDRLVMEAEKRNIGIILDLVLNHTSSKHPWFIEAKQDALEGRCDEPGSKCRWYNFSSEPGNGTTMLANNLYYESGFWSEMPDLNLDNEEVRQEIKRIVEFWIEHGVSGFRLDAAYHYYGGNAEKNNEFLAWLNEIIAAVKEDFFVVAEVWSDQNTILSHYASGTDSFFNFPASGTDGRIVSAIRKQSGSALASWMVENTQKIKGINPKAADSVFLSNHDQGRSGAFFGKDTQKTQLMVSTLMFAPGNVFVYYGEEIGMLGSGNDPNKRLAMLWQSDSKEGIPFNPTGSDYTSQRETSVKDQEKEESSLLNFYRKAASLRNKSTLYKEGNCQALDDGNEAVYMMQFSNDSSALIVVHNFSDVEQNVEIVSEIEAADHLNELNKIKEKQLIMQPYSTSILYIKG